MDTEPTLPVPTPDQRRILWSGLTALAVCAQVGVAALAVYFFIQFLCWSYPILLPIGLAVLVALVLDPLVTVLQQRGMRRGAATILVCVLMVVTFLLFWAYILPPLLGETGGFFRSLPDSIRTFSPKIRENLAGMPSAQTWFDANMGTLQKDLAQSAAAALYAALAPVGHAFGFLLGFGFVPIYVYYFLADQDEIARRWHEYVPLRRAWLRDEVISVLVEINQSLVAYFRGQIVVAGVNGVLTFIGLSLIPHMPYALVLGVIAGVLSIVPFLGIIVSIIPALLLAFLSASDPTGQWLRPLLVVLVFTVVQMSESMFVTPRVQSHSTGLHPLAIILGILVWSQLLPGLLGPVVAVPLTSAVVVLLRRYVWPPPAVAVLPAHAEPVVEKPQEGKG